MKTTLKVLGLLLVALIITAVLQIAIYPLDDHPTDPVLMLCIAFLAVLAALTGAWAFKRLKALDARIKALEAAAQPTPAPTSAPTPAPTVVGAP